MSGTSIQNGDRKIIFQVFCGRWETANVLDHPGRVLRELTSFDWTALKHILGLTHIYLLGLWDTTGPIIVDEEQGLNLRDVDHRCSSPFAISDHTQVSPLLGTKDDLISLVNCLHASNLGVLVDFVPNHTGLGHTWIINHPEYYKKDEIGDPRRAFSGDVAELNYLNPELEREMTGIVETLFATYPIDGIRCDMAHLVPTHFWSNVIPLIRQKKPEALFIAEAYSDSLFDLSPQHELLEAGFSAIYDEPLFRNARSTAQSIKPLFGHVDYELSQLDDRWVHYVSNHDDSSWCVGEKMWGYQQIFLMLKGWSLLYNGTLWGFEGRLAHHWVQILEKTFYDPTLFPEERRHWFEWYLDERPHITEFNLLSDHSVAVGWQGRASQGVLRYTF